MAAVKNLSEICSKKINKKDLQNNRYHSHKKRKKNKPAIDPSRPV